MTNELKDNFNGMIITLLNLIVVSGLIVFFKIIPILQNKSSFLWFAYGFEICFFIWCAFDYYKLNNRGEREDKKNEPL